MFVSNPPKDLLRRDFDAPVIRKKFRGSYDDVTYFGMPGPSMLDVQQWRKYLGFVIAVENKPQNIGVMKITAGTLGLSNNIQVLQGDVEAILATWEDDLGEIPAKESFQVVNLDFEGGFIGFSDILKHDKRIDAIRELFRHQKNGQTPFVLFLTVGFREKSGQEYDQKLHHINEDLTSVGVDAQDTISWYLSQSTKYKLKVYVPYLIDEIGRANRFCVDKFLCFSYQGTKRVPMMHFIFDFQYCIESISPKRIGLSTLLNAPLFIAYGTRVEQSKICPPPISGGQ